MDQDGEPRDATHPRDQDQHEAVSPHAARGEAISSLPRNLEVRPGGSSNPRDQHETMSHAARRDATHPRDLTFLLQEDQVNLLQVTAACYREPATLLLQIWTDLGPELHDDVKQAIIDGVSGAIARDRYADFQLIHFLEHPEFHQGILQGFKELWSSLRFSVGNTTLWIDSSKGKEYNCSQQEKEYLLGHCLDRSSIMVRIGNQQKSLAIWLSPKAKQIMHRAHQFELAVLSQPQQIISDKK